MGLSEDEHSFAALPWNDSSSTRLLNVAPLWPGMYSPVSIEDMSANVFYLIHKKIFVSVLHIKI